jgi:hypothetical protein
MVQYYWSEECCLLLVAMQEEIEREQLLPESSQLQGCCRSFFLFYICHVDVLYCSDPSLSVAFFLFMAYAICRMQAHDYLWLMMTHTAHKLWAVGDHSVIDDPFVVSTNNKLNLNSSRHSDLGPKWPENVRLYLWSVGKWRLKAEMLQLHRNRTVPFEYVIRDGIKNNAFSFSLAVENALANRFLLPGDILILDNASIHCMYQGEKTLVWKTGCMPYDHCGIFLVFLPPWSPWLNPIELMWNELVMKLRTWDLSRPRPSGNAAAHVAACIMDSFTHDDVMGCHRHCD